MSNVRAFNIDQTASIDYFSRKGFAARLAKAIEGQPEGECLVISIDGEWGSGKTSLIQWVCDEFADGASRPDYLPCIPIKSFNPWEHTGEISLIFNLFSSIVKEVDEDTQLLTLWQRLKRYAETILRSRAPGESGKLIGGGIMKPIIEGTADCLANMFSLHLKEVRSRVEQLILRAKKRFVVILDDVDRLEAKDLILLLRILKINAQLPNVTYLIAMDEREVAKTIAAEHRSELEFGRAYLEKLVQVRLPLPAIAPQSIRRFTVDQLARVIDRPEVLKTDRFQKVFDALYLDRIKTPRSVKILCNNVGFLIDLLPDEVDAVDVILLESARLFFPLLYQQIKSGSLYLRPSYRRTLETLHGTVSSKTQYMEWLALAWIKDGIESELEKYKHELGLWFPQVLADQFQINVSNSWWREKRLCSPDYHWRYFTYAILEDDVSNSEVVELTTRCYDREESLTALKSALEGDKGQVIAYKLCLLNTDLDKALQLAHALARIGDRHIAVDQVDTAFIAARVLNNHTAEDQIKIQVTEIATNGELNWVERFLSSVSVVEQGSQHQNKVQDKAQTILAHRCLDRLKGIDASNVEVIVDDLWTVYHRGDVDALKEVIDHRILDDPLFSIALIASACGKRTEEKHEKVWHWNDLESLQILSKIADPKIVYQQAIALSTSGRYGRSEDLSVHRYCSAEELIFEFLDSYKRWETSMFQNS